MRSRIEILSFNGPPRSRALVTPAINSCFAEAGMITDSNLGGDKTTSVTAYALCSL
jgi:hypothetical protein